MKILLDIDGVMVRQKPWKTEPAESDGMPEFSPQAVLAFNEFFAGCDVVVNSSHRHRFTCAEWLEIFSRRGVDVGSMSMTGNGDRLRRTLEWISQGEPDYVVIDDSAELNELGVSGRLIKTSPLIGLQTKTIEEWMTTPDVGSRGSSWPTETTREDSSCARTGQEGPITSSP